MRFLKHLLNLIRKPEPPKDWALLELEHDDTGQEEIHIIPRNDHIIHAIPNDQCICGPTWEQEHGVNLYQHHSLDGREATE